MGDPRKLRKKYSTPNHPWQKSRIDLEKELIKKYGLRNKKEIWRMVSLLKKYHQAAKKLVALHTKQAEIEKTELITSLHSYGLLKMDADILDVLEINIENILDRRLQTILVKKSLARSNNQARQFITHGHVLINGKKIDSPSYLVKEAELESIKFNDFSKLSEDDHPERVVIEKVVENGEEK